MKKEPTKIPLDPSTPTTKKVQIFRLEPLDKVLDKATTQDQTTIHEDTKKSSET